MKYRWTTEVNNLNFALYEIKRLSKHLIRKKKGGRGRPPKHNPISYVQVIVLKELEKQSLRKAETRITKFVVGRRIDHSVISYWENKPEIANCLKIIVSRAGQLLDKMLNPLFSFVDATKFTTWNIKEIAIHVCNRVAKQTVYPIGTSFLTHNVRSPVNEAVPPGTGKLYADAWYDDNKTIGVLFKKGYTPIVCPNKGRWKGFYRHKARELYSLRENRLGYRQRGRGESMFGSLTNEFGDRFKACREESMQVRILGRIVCYQIKLLIRCDDKIISTSILIIRHAHFLVRFINWVLLNTL